MTITLNPDDLSQVIEAIEFRRNRLAGWLNSHPEVRDTGFGKAFKVHADKLTNILTKIHQEIK